LRTNIVLDDESLNEAFRCSNARTKRELIDQALREFVAQRKRLDLRELRGKDLIDSFLRLPTRATREVVDGSRGHIDLDRFLRQASGARHATP
jgi:Arc/MetJ family transcription regulator